VRLLERDMCDYSGLILSQLRDCIRFAHIWPQFRVMTSWEKNLQRFFPEVWQILQSFGLDFFYVKKFEKLGFLGEIFQIQRLLT